jgi:Barstar (barnase inhibitor)
MSVPAAGNFRFSGAVTSAKDFIAAIPQGLNTRTKLFEALKRELHIPDYFGNNWDALSDCLRDLSWIEQRRVIAFHTDLPPLPEQDLVQYLEVLNDAVCDWKPGEKHELIAVFPRESESAIAGALSKAA